MVIEYQMEDCKPVATPSFQGLDLAVDQSNEVLEDNIYRQLIGSLLP